MKPSQIDTFFRTLSQKWPYPTKIILTGGGYALLQGGSRTTEDLDFEVETKNMEQFTDALKETSFATGIPPQFSEDIDHWSQISYLDYKAESRLYKKFGKIGVYLPTVIHWGIGKVTRYLNQDVTDLISVYKKNRPDPIRVAKKWREAITKSPRSNALFLAKKNMLSFFQNHGKKIWGKKIDLGEVQRILS